MPSRKIVFKNDPQKGAICKNCHKSCEVVELFILPDEMWEYSACCSDKYDFWEIDENGEKKWGRDEGCRYEE